MVLAATDRIQQAPKHQSQGQARKESREAVYRAPLSCLPSPQPQPRTGRAEGLPDTTLPRYRLPLSDPHLAIGPVVRWRGAVHWGGRGIGAAGVFFLLGRGRASSLRPTSPVDAAEENKKQAFGVQ